MQSPKATPDLPELPLLTHCPPNLPGLQGHTQLPTALCPAPDAPPEQAVGLAHHTHHPLSGQRDRPTVVSPASLKEGFVVPTRPRTNPVSTTVIHAP